MPYKNREVQLNYMKQWRKDNLEKNLEYNKQRKKQWYIKNKKHFLECLDQWKKMNPEHIKEYNKKYLIENRKKVYASNRQWAKTEKGKMVKQRGNIARRVRNNNIINNLTLQEWLDILEEYNYRCAYCGCEFDEDTLPTKDHVIPISKAGHNIKENVVPACQSCNSKKNNKIIIGIKGGKAWQNR